MILSGDEVHPGELRTARITEATDYDLVGDVGEFAAEGDSEPALAQAPAALHHRASDGHRGGQLLAAIEGLLQEPEAL